MGTRKAKIGVGTLAGLGLLLALAGNAILLTQWRKAQHNANAIAARLDQVAPAKGHEHAGVRQWMIRQQLARVGRSS